MSHDAHAHVVNDVVGGVPISVTYCDLYRCTRVFTTITPGGPLDLSVGGVKSGGLILRVGGHSYRQDSGAPLQQDSPPFPYDLHLGEVRTWGQWRRAHPDTDVYLGLTASEPPPASAPAAEPAPRAELKAVPPDRLGEWLATALHVGAAPVLVGCATLLIHVLLAHALRQRGAGAARAS
jgi:hypothetical protein